ncbi:MAG: hypothetical protein FWC71_02515 [Defluviitaleaceae bacterium]|nr:hypothetical protein [Defluviitaleaceae bacterium]
MERRKLLIFLTAFHAITNTAYLSRFVGILPPEGVVYGYVPWFMSFALPNTAFSLLAWLLLYALVKKQNTLAAISGLLVAGGLIFHALNGFMFGFYTSYLQNLSFNAIFEIAVYTYGLALAAFYISQFKKLIANK